MKKKYKGYFKKSTRTRPDVKFKNQVIKSFNFTENPRVGLWVNTYLKYINKL